jgi:hypothetical protein
MIHIQLNLTCNDQFFFRNRSYLIIKLLLRDMIVFRSKYKYMSTSILNSNLCFLTTYQKYRRVPNFTIFYFFNDEPIQK